MTEPVDTNLLDRWTTVHALAGAAAGAFGAPPGLAFWAGLAYEIAEYVNDRVARPITLLPRSPESVPNMIADVAVYMGSYYVARDASGDGFRRHRGPIYGAAALGGAAGLALALMPSSNFVQGR